MNAIYLHLPNGEATKWSMCSECGKVAAPGNIHLSQKCCTCYECGEILPKDERTRYAIRKGYSLYHRKCDEKRRSLIEAKALESAELVEGYEGPVYFEGLYGSYGDGYFSDVDDLEDAVNDLPEDERPEFAFCCKETPFFLNIDHAMEAALDDMDEDAGERLNGTNELAAAVKAFNDANKGVVSFYPDRKRKVAIPWRQDG